MEKESLMFRDYSLPFFQRGSQSTESQSLETIPLFVELNTLRLVMLDPRVSGKQGILTLIEFMFVTSLRFLSKVS